MLGLPRCQTVEDGQRCKRGAYHMEATGFHCDQHSEED